MKKILASIKIQSSTISSQQSSIVGIMKEQLQIGLDFYFETQKQNPFHLHKSSNAASQALVHLRNQAFILNKLSLLPNTIITSLEQQLFQLSALCMEGVANNPNMSFKSFQAVRDLVLHIQLYYKRLIINRSSAEVGIYWPGVRAALMTIQDKIPKTGYHWIREYVIIRRALLEPDKNYFVSQMLAKKIETQELRDLIAVYKNQKSIESVIKSNQIQINNDENQSNSMDHSQVDDIRQIKRRIRMIPLSDRDKNWQYLQKICKNCSQLKLQKEEQLQLKQYIFDILQSYLSKRKIQNPNSPKFRANSLRGRVLMENLGRIN